MRISNRRLVCLLAAVLVVAAAAAAILWLTGSGGTKVVVTVDGLEFGAYPLYADRTVTIGPEDGSWHNTLQIRGGRAEIVDSDCKNQICVNTPALSADTIGVIVCLPHSVVVEIKNG